MSGVEAALLQRLVKDDLGVDAATVVCVLLQRGAMQMAELKELTGFEWKLLRNLCVLLYKQQVIVVQVHTATQDKDTRLTIKYAANKAGIYARLRHARYLMLIENLYGPGARLLALQSVKHGWLSAAQAA